MRLTGAVLTARQPFISPLLFCLVGVFCIFYTAKEPIGDFGNYYYGSRLLLDGHLSTEIYSSLHYFNSQVTAYGEKDFFGNYIPVPPCSAVLYIPFLLLDPMSAKLLFNCLSILIFSFVFYRLLLYHQVRENTFILILPFIFLYPLLNNIVQGQSYLLLSALLICTHLGLEQNRIYLSAIYLALAISLKIFPVIFLLYLILKKKYKLLFLVLISVIIISVLPIFFTSSELLTHYYGSVLPRLFNNDVVGRYFAGNQSIDSALLTLFSVDQFNNPHPLINSTVLIILLESIFAAFLLNTFFCSSQLPALKYFSFFLAGNLLLSRYIPSYSLFLMVPLGLIFAMENHQKVNRVLLVLLFIAITLPVNLFANAPVVLRYARLELLIVIFVFFVYSQKIELRSSIMTILFVALFLFNFSTYHVIPSRYFPIQNKEGILYDFNLSGNTLSLFSTLGTTTKKETYLLNGKAEENKFFVLKENDLYYKGQLLISRNDNKRKPFLYNDTLAVFMSDLNQGIGFFKLQMIPIPQRGH